MQALPFAIPAAAAGLAYLNARYSISYDWNTLSSIAVAAAGAHYYERYDNLNLFNFLESTARGSRKDHAWIIHNGRSWTYAQAYEIVLKYGTWLKGKGVQKNEIVAIDFTNSEVFIWIWYGLWSIGAKPALINYNLTGQPLMHTIRTSTARLVLVDEEVKDNFSEDVMLSQGFVARPPEVQEYSRERPIRYHDPVPQPQISPKISSKISNRTTETPDQPRRLEIVFFDKQLQAHIESSEGVRQPNDLRSGEKLNDIALLIYTSGTTGLPKPAVMSWEKANLGARFVAGWIPLKKTDIMYTCMPLYHSSASVLGVCSTLRAETTIAIGKRFGHKTFWPELRAAKATIIQYVGETCRYLLAAPKSDLDKKHSVRVAFGNGMRPDVWQPFKERFGISTICEFYAATEAPAGLWNRSTSDFSACALGRNGALVDWLNRSRSVLVKIDPESDSMAPLRDPKTGLCQLAGYDEPGEFIFQLDPTDTTKKFQGYFGNQKATNSKILRDVKAKGDAWFRSGDLLRKDKEGRWFFVDRTGDTFRWRSENVSTAEVSDVIGKHEAIEEANVYGVLVPRHDGRAGCAAVIFKRTEKVEQKSKSSKLQLPSPKTLKSLADHLQKSLPKYAVPVFLRITDSMPTTGTNKQQKTVLQQEGIDVDRVGRTGDILYWLVNGTYERFTNRDLEHVKGGGVRL